jgi:hypothetical protein
MITTAQKHRYAQAVLSGEFKKTAYSHHVNPHAANPSTAAWRLEQTQSMQAIMAEELAERDRRNTLRFKTYDMLEGSLRLIDRLNDKAITLSHQDAIKTLVQTGKLLKSIDKYLRDLPDIRPLAADNDPWGEDRNRRPVPDIFADIFV